MVVAQTCSVLIYFSSIIFLSSIFNVGFIGADFLVKILTITLISWFPLHLFKIIMKYVDPTDYEKIRKQAKLKNKMERKESINV